MSGRVQFWCPRVDNTELDEASVHGVMDHCGWEPGPPDDSDQTPFVPKSLNGTAQLTGLIHIDFSRGKVAIEDLREVLDLEGLPVSLVEAALANVFGAS